MANKKILVDGTSIRINKDNYVSLTDIAKRSTDRVPNQVIRGWLRNTNTINFLATWEEVHNTDFKHVQMDTFRKQASDNRKKISAQTYIEQTGAIGMVSNSGRYGGTYAHSDIALNFCYWLSPEFQVYFLKEFQRLKEDEARRLNQEWSIRRELAKAHYPMLKEAVLNHMPLQENKAGFYLADEANLINQIVFGMTARQWRAKNPNTGSQNMRDFATTEQLLLVANLETMDAQLIKWDCDKPLRTELLEKFAQDLKRHYRESASIQRIKGMEDRYLK